MKRKDGPVPNRRVYETLIMRYASVPRRAPSPAANRSIGPIGRADRPCNARAEPAADPRALGRAAGQLGSTGSRRNEKEAHRDLRWASSCEPVLQTIFTLAPWWAVLRTSRSLRWRGGRRRRTSPYPLTTPTVSSGTGSVPENHSLTGHFAEQCGRRQAAVTSIRTHRRSLNRERSRPLRISRGLRTAPTGHSSSRDQCLRNTGSTATHATDAIPAPMIIDEMSGLLRGLLHG